MPRLSRAAIGWALYDWATSAYALCILAGFFPILFESYWASDLPAARETFWYGLLVSTASLIGALVAPFLGALADVGGSRKRWLVTFTLLGMCATFLLTFVGRGDWPLAGMVFVLGTVGYYGAYIAYNGLLPVVSSEENRHFLSGFGFAMGYLGGVVLFLGSILLIKLHRWFGLESTIDAIRVAFIAAVVWWGLFTIPLLVTVREPPWSGSRISVGKSMSCLAETLREIFRNKSILWFLLACWLYIDGVNTVVAMASNYGKTLGFTTDVMLITLVLSQVVGVPSTLLITWLSQRYRARPFLYFGIGLYLIIVTYGALMPTTPIRCAGIEIEGVYVLGFLVGLGQGGVQALSRSTFSLLIPRDRTATYFGVYNMLGQYAAFLGPLLMGVVSRVGGSPRYGVASLVILFAVGALVLTRVPIEKTG